MVTKRKLLHGAVYFNSSRIIAQHWGHGSEGEMLAMQAGRAKFGPPNPHKKLALPHVYITPMQWEQDRQTPGISGQLPQPQDELQVSERPRLQN